MVYWPVNGGHWSVVLLMAWWHALSICPKSLTFNLYLAKHIMDTFLNRYTYCITLSHKAYAPKTL